MSPASNMKGSRVSLIARAAAADIGASRKIRRSMRCRSPVQVAGDLQRMDRRIFLEAPMSAAAALAMSDTLLPFMFEAGDIRGAVVDLDGTWREVLARRDYPLPVRSLLGEAMAA